MSHTHFIANVNLTVSATRSADGFALQKEVSSAFWATIIPALSDVFDRFVGADEVIKIDRLDIQLPSIAWADWQTELPPSVCRAVKEALEQLLYAQTANWTTLNNRVERRTMRQNLFDGWLFFLKTGQKPLIHGSEADIQQAALDKVASDARAVEILRGVLRQDATVRERLVFQYDTVYLTHLAEAMSGRKQTEVAALGQTLAAVWSQPFFLQKIKKATQTRTAPLSERDVEVQFWLLVFEQLAESVQTLDLPMLVERLTQRLVSVFLPNDWVKLLTNIVFVPKTASRKIKDEKKRHPSVSAPSKSSEMLLDAPVLPFLGENQETDLAVSAVQIAPLFVQFIQKTAANGTIADVLVAFFKKEIVRHATVIGTVLKDSVKHLTHSPLFLEKKKDETADSLSETLTNKTELPPSVSEVEKGKNKVTDALQTAQVPPLQKENNQLESLRETTEKPFDKVAETDRKQGDFELEDEDSVPVRDMSEVTEWVASNAGLVLLHPFLKPFLDSVGLLMDGKFENIKARRRAAALLHYLATGQTEMAEFDMVLPKVLVGLPLHKSLDRHFVPTDLERKEADGLLRAVVSHWKALGDTSPDGLREGFLQRQGLLTRRDDGWLLKMETRTLDILLDRLPWGLSVVRLGWMKEFLYVEWY